MKNVSLVISIISLIAAITFGVLFLTKDTKKAEAPAEGEATESIASKGDIVYVDLDRILMDYDMANDLRSVVETKAQNIQAEITRRGKKLENEVKSFQEKMNKGLMTRSVAEAQQQKLMQQEQEFNEYAGRKQQEIQEEQVVMMNQLGDAIKTFIDNDQASTKKKLARVGVDYYEGKHDIRNYRVFFINAEGKLQEDETKSNFKIAHPFFQELVDQEVQYMLSGKDGFMKSDIPELQQELDAYFNENEDFTAELYEILTGAVVKGFEFAYAFKGEDDRTQFLCADSVGVVEVEARFASDKKDHILYWYVDRVDKDGKKIKRIQDWDDTQTAYYIQENDGTIKKDTAEKLNPKPHIVYQEGNDGKLYSDSYGLIPFFRLDNNKKQQSGLMPIKDIVDDYDLMNAGLTNNIQDTNEALYVVKGFQGDNLDELMVNIKAKKHIGVDEEGGVEIHTIDIPYEARKIKMEIDEKNIFRFGFGVSMESLKDTSATTSIAIKSAYALLDLKANKLEIRLKQFMRKLLKVVLKEINDRDGTDYQQKDVYFNFEREIITNEQEHAQIELTEAQKKQTEITTLLNIAAHLDNETLMELIFEQLDLNYDDYKDKLPKPDDNGGLAQAQATLDGIVPEDDPDGGGVIE